MSGLFSAQVRDLYAGHDPQLVLLDLDGTLIDSVPDLAAAVDSMLTQLNYASLGSDNVSHWIGNGADMLVRRALVHAYAEANPNEKDKEKQNDEAANRLSHDEVSQARAYFDTAYLNALHNATGMFTGVSEFLLNCTIPKVLITNKPRKFTVPLLRSLGWENTFVGVFCGDDLSEKKPSPMPLLVACQQQQISPENALMVGDSRHDIQAAKAAGIATVGVTYGYNHGDDIALSNPDLTCDSLLSLLNEIR
ncbi:MAG: phosphoglycolate phosphatase [Oleibacter sp.]|nr:phosphoglycolate phosphatase [Thalassolituus sp.]